MKKFITHLIIIAAIALVMVPELVLAGVTNGPTIDIPTLNEWGLIGTAVVLGVAGLYNIIKRK